ncbi:hypothetical protein FJTKL_13285 [Diaporthe vaccinii]|uniref:Uncharacterized protein n=1 Tax=Diaporthe vaccinii TaxID=105482 RepID=A0ABR4EB27_9PEZI
MLQRSRKPCASDSRSIPESSGGGTHSPFGPGQCKYKQERASIQWRLRARNQQPEWLLAPVDRMVVKVDAE